MISLLQGEIPERSVFRVPIHRKTLSPYLELTQGDFSVHAWDGNSYEAEDFLYLRMFLVANLCVLTIFRNLYRFSMD